MFRLVPLPPTGWPWVSSKAHSPPVPHKQNGGQLCARSYWGPQRGWKDTADQGLGRGPEDAQPLRGGLGASAGRRRCTELGAELVPELRYSWEAAKRFSEAGRGREKQARRGGGGRPGGGDCACGSLSLQGGGLQRPEARVVGGTAGVRVGWLARSRTRKPAGGQNSRAGSRGAGPRTRGGGPKEAPCGQTGSVGAVSVSRPPATKKGP